MATRYCTNCRQPLDEDSLPVGPKLAQWLCSSCMDLIENPWKTKRATDRGRFWSG